MHDMDEMFDSILGDFDDMFCNPLLPYPRTSRPPPYLLRWVVPALNNAHGIAQDYKRLEIAMDVRGVEAGAIDFRLGTRMAAC